MEVGTSKIQMKSGVTVYHMIPSAHYMVSKKKTCQIFKFKALKWQFFHQLQNTSHSVIWRLLSPLNEEEIRQAATHWKPLGLAIS